MPRQTNNAYAISDHSDNSSDNHNTVNAPVRQESSGRPNGFVGRRRGSSSVSNNTEKNLNNSNLFIRNLDSRVDQEDLNRVFSAFGEIVSSVVMRNIHTGESLGTAFVRYATHEEARNALENLHNCRELGHSMAVQWAKRHDGAPVGEERDKILKLFVRNVPLSTTVEELTALFAAHGPVSSATIHKDTTPGIGDEERRIAFVLYSKPCCAAAAAQAIHHTQPFPGCAGIPLLVKLATDDRGNSNHGHGHGSNAAGASSSRQKYRRGSNGSNRSLAPRLSLSNLESNNSQQFVNSAFETTPTAIVPREQRRRSVSFGNTTPPTGSYSQSSSSAFQPAPVTPLSPASGKAAPVASGPYRHDPYNPFCSIVLI